MKKIQKVSLQLNQTKPLPQEWDCISIHSKTGHLNYTPAFLSWTIAFLPLYLPHCLFELSDCRSYVLFFLVFSIVFGSHCYQIDKYSYLPQWTVRTLKTETPCYSSLNHQHLRQGLGHNIIQLWLPMIIKFIVYIISGCPVTISAIKNNYSLLFFFQYLLWRSSFVGLQTGRKNTHTQTLSYRFLLKKEKVMGTRRWTQRAGLDVARWRVVSASMGCVSDTELGTDKSEVSHYPFTFTSPFWKNYTHILFLLIIMNVYNH